ncbi:MULTISPECIES: hypothetical protein [unclassified Pseudomonas]|uniref:hypothetical protein n=1 Tax=unclassified Pseudomonas TaxID=196821 RepID=UPI0011A09C2D|nr:MULTISPECIES: hypothetical protein [unclassified Pseudomonas]
MVDVAAQQGIGDKARRVTEFGFGGDQVARVKVSSLFKLFLENHSRCLVEHGRLQFGGWLHPSAHAWEWAEVMPSAFSAHLFVAVVLFAAERQVLGAHVFLASDRVESLINDVSIDRLLYWLAASNAFNGCVCLCFGHRVFLRLSSQSPLKERASVMLSAGTRYWRRSPAHFELLTPAAALPAGKLITVLYAAHPGQLPSLWTVEAGPSLPFDGWNLSKLKLQVKHAE